MRKISIILCCYIAFMLAGCGTVKKVVEEEKIPMLPGQQEADSLVSSFSSEGVPSVAFPVSMEMGPKVYGFQLLEKENSVRVLILSVKEGMWQVENTSDYEWLDNSALKFSGFQDTVATMDMYGNGQPILTFSTLSKNNSEAEYDVFVYNSANSVLQKACLSGKLLPDGRIEGMSNKLFIENASSPENKWMIERLESNNMLIELTEAEIMTDQAVEWWLGKNPGGSASKKIIFGTIPSESTLVRAYQTANDKQKGGSYTAALFDHRGYTVIVVRKASGEYILAWAEPVCQNKDTDPLLNTIYFEKGSQLALFYYHGRKTYKVHLNLANGSSYKS